MNNPQQLKERIYALNPELREETSRCSECLREVVYHGGILVKQNPIDFRHVLNSISKDIMLGDEKIDIRLTPYKLWIAKKGEPMTICFNLTKTFDQNIAENEELVTFLLNIIK